MFKNRRVRTFAIAMALSGVASIIGLFLYSLPLATLTFANRVEDYVLVNNAVTYMIGDTPQQKNDYFEMLHLPHVQMEEQNSNLKLIMLDEQSYAGDLKSGLPPFPYPRGVYQRVLEKLHKAGASVVAFDVDFLENATDASQDAKFAAGMRQMPTVLPFIVNTTSAGNLGRIQVASHLAPYTSAQGYTTVDNPGGLLLGQPYTIDTNKEHLLSLVGATIQKYSGRQITRSSDEIGDFGKAQVPLFNGLLMLLPFTDRATQDITHRVGSEQTTVNFVETMPFIDAFKADQGTMNTFAKGNIIVIGPTAAGSGDFILTPLGRFPGVYANLRMIDQMMSGKFIRPVSNWLNILLIVTLPFLLGFFVTQFAATRGILLCLVAILVYAFIAITLYAQHLVWLDLMHVAGAMLLATLFVAIYRTITEGADKKMIKNMFGAHVSPEVVAEMLKGDDPKHALALQGKRVKATIFYSDIRGFTSMSENMTPEEIYGQLNEYFEEMCAIIFKYGGYVDKFIGDCVMAVFSAPNQKPDDAKRAVLAAIEQQAKIVEMGAAWAKEGRQIFTVGMGCNTGEVVMGNLGSSTRLIYTVIGDNVNTAARLYNVAKGGETIISESTWEEVKDFVEVEELEPVTVKGKVKPLRIFNVIGMKKEPSVAPVSVKVVEAESTPT
ncbi:MAG: CHASE2 domain-containing protein [Candidatus Baltobacteraceae bacterium]